MLRKEPELALVDAIDVTGGVDVDGAEVVAVDDEAPAAAEDVDGESPPLDVDGSWSFFLGDVALPLDVDGRLAWAAATLCEYCVQPIPEVEAARAA